MDEDDDYTVDVEPYGPVAYPVGPPREYPLDEDYCGAYIGHDWADAGGGLLICMICEAEDWDY